MKIHLVVPARDVRFGDIVFVGVNNNPGCTTRPHMVVDPNSPTKHPTPRQMISFSDGTGIAVFPEERLAILREAS